MALVDRLFESVVATLALPLFAPERPWRAGSGGRPASSVAPEDAAFAARAAESAMAVAIMSELALDRAHRAEIREFARLMVAEHRALSAELARLAADKWLELPAAAPAEARTAFARLSDLAGEEFDAAYLRRMVEDHETAVADCEHQSDSGSDDDLTGLAARTLPRLREHLDAARGLLATGLTAKPGRRHKGRHKGHG